MDPQCSKCRHFCWMDSGEVELSDDNWDHREYGQCRFNPPSIVSADCVDTLAVNNDASWPLVNDYDWCGQFAEETT